MGEFKIHHLTPSLSAGQSLSRYLAYYITFSIGGSKTCIVINFIFRQPRSFATIAGDRRRGLVDKSR